MPDIFHSFAEYQVIHQFEEILLEISLGRFTELGVLGYVRGHPQGLFKS